MTEMCVKSNTAVARPAAVSLPLMRRAGPAEIYFFTNQTPRSETTEV